jgi:FKBP-type peptidyl-prolyl cis-trans isomerase
MRTFLPLAALGLLLLAIALTTRFGIVNFDDTAEREREHAILAAFPDSFKEISGLRFRVLQQGSGARVYPGQEVVARFEARTLQGDPLPTLGSRGEPVRLRAGQSGLGRGFDEGLLGMVGGERRTLIVPPHLGFGRVGRKPDVPPDIVIVFDVEVLEVR